MRNIEAEALKEALEKALAESDRLWDSKEQSPAYIVGHLQGTLKASIVFLESRIEKK